MPETRAPTTQVVTAVGAAPFRLSLLGRFELSGPQGFIEIQGKKLVGLLAFLAITSPRAQSRESLAGLLWGSHSQVQARQNLRQSLYRLRHLLGRDVLVSGAEEVSVAADAIACDVTRFEALIRDGSREARWGAKDLYRDRFLADVAIDEEHWTVWVNVQRQRLDNLALEAMVGLAGQELEEGHPQQALRAAERAIEIDSLREDAHRLVIRALTASGRRTDALKHYDHLVELLRHELDVEPDAETMSLIADVRKSGGLVLGDVNRMRTAGGGGGDRRPVVDVSAPVPGFGDRPAVAVLPFRSFSPRGEDEYLCDGLTEDLVSGLSNLRWFPVIAWNSMTRFRHSGLEPDQIGRALGARYLLSGSVRAFEQELRVSTSLVDAESGLTLWSHRFDFALGNILQVQDEIVTRVVAALDEEVDQAEQVRFHTRRSESPGTWELVRRARWHTNKFTKEDAVQAAQLLDEARKRDPDSVDALIEFAWWHWYDVFARREKSKGLLLVEQFAQQAIRLDKRDARGHLLLGIAQFMTKRNEQGRASLQEATRLNPSLAAAQACIGSAYILAGEPEKAIAPVLLGLRLNPHYMRLFHPLNELAIAYYMTGRWEDAQDYAGRSIRLRPGYWYAHVVLVGSTARAGDLGQAREALQEFKAHCPNFVEDHIRWLPFLDPKWHEFLIEGLVLAGYRPAKGASRSVLPSD